MIPAPFTDWSAEIVSQKLTTGLLDNSWPLRP
jgi:hypothetical protein